MTQPCQHLIDAVGCWARGNCGPCDHHNGQAQRARGRNLGRSAMTASVLGHKFGDAMRFHQRNIALYVKGAARNDGMGVGQRQWRRGRIDQSQQIGMLRLGCKSGQMHAPQRQKHPFRWPAQRGDCAGHIGHIMPAVVWFSAPCGPFKRQQRHVGRGGGQHGMPTHLCRKGVGCIDQMGDRVFAQILRQTVWSSESANTDWQWLRARCLRAPGVRQAGPHAPLCQRLGQRAGFGGAAKNKKVGCHV